MGLDLPLPLSVGRSGERLGDLWRSRSALSYLQPSKFALSGIGRLGTRRSFVRASRARLWRPGSSQSCTNPPQQSASRLKELHVARRAGSGGRTPPRALDDPADGTLAAAPP
ncbi:hypothetical protein PsYK624_007490 [Phanerochaete sordida]|uniref:Uncharacterized protein n=1 Tax=Phanerochaete sordida TaxID=48140 RepID=A0A9P3L868_9APHY|nr:hypothetical protein PsYK624_007490 [Phanerochaete sordida]